MHEWVGIEKVNFSRQRAPNAVAQTLDEDEGEVDKLSESKKLMTDVPNCTDALTNQTCQ